MFCVLGDGGGQSNRARLHRCAEGHYRVGEFFRSGQSLVFEHVELLPGIIPIGLEEA